jgi:hypothetical protein
LLSSLTTTILRDLATELGPGETSDSLTTLKDALRKVPDPRHRRGVRYALVKFLRQFDGFFFYATASWQRSW